MLVRELMTCGPALVTRQETVAAAGRAMLQRRCGFLPVLDPDTQQLVGVVTDRDMFRQLVLTDQPASQTRIAACVSRHVHTVEAGAELEEAATIMERAAVHRLPVLDGGRVVGVLSLKDIARAAQQHAHSLGPNPAERQMADVMEAIAAAQIAQH